MWSSAPFGADKSQSAAFPNELAWCGPLTPFGRAESCPVPLCRGATGPGVLGRAVDASQPDRCQGVGSPAVAERVLRADIFKYPVAEFQQDGGGGAPARARGSAVSCRCRHKRPDLAY